jgi:hypothetical protein
MVTVHPRPKQPLTPAAQDLLEGLRAAQTWVTRSELARMLDKHILNKWDFVLLERLVEEGLIEVRRQERPGGIGFEFQYRALPQV